MAEIASLTGAVPCAGTDLTRRLTGIAQVGSVVIHDDVEIGSGTRIASRSTVYEDVPAGAVWGGFPARPKRQWMREVVVLQKLAARDGKKSKGGPRGGPAGT